MVPVKTILRNISILSSTSFLEKSWFSEIFLLVFIVPNQAARYNCFYSRKRTFVLICNIFSTSAALFKKNHCNYSIFNNRIKKKILILFNIFCNLLLIYVFFVQYPSYFLPRYNNGKQILNSVPFIWKHNFNIRSENRSLIVQKLGL